MVRVYKRKRNQRNYDRDQLATIERKMKEILHYGRLQRLKGFLTQQQIGGSHSDQLGRIQVIQPF